MLGCGVILTLLQVLIPFLIGDAVNVISSIKKLADITTISVEIVSIAAVASVFQFGLGYGGQYLGQKIIYDMRNRIFVSIQGQSFSFHDTNQTGQLMARATGDVEALRRFLAFGFPQLLGQVLLMIGVPIALFFLNVELGLIVAIALPILVFISWKFSQTQAPFWAKARLNYGEINAVLQENITGMKVVRTFSAEDHEIERFREKNEEYRDDIIGAAKIRSFYTPLLTLLISITLGAVYFVGGLQVLGLPSHSIAIAAEVVSGAFLVALLQGPVRFLGQMILILQNGMAGFTRVLDITEASVEVTDRPGAIELQQDQVKGRISFENVRFGYGKDREILKGINLVIEPGEIVAFIGATGSGKTTLANLVPRFYDVSSGGVLLDGIDVRDIKLKSLRSNIGIVSQDIFLFSATIRENISYGRPDTSLDAVIRAAKIANVNEFVERLPEGYDTLVGERGITLSGGQKQRIAIARTLITDPKVLIMDDSLSSVDVQTEYAIQDALRAVVAGRTTIIITQRLSTLRLAKRIVVFENGLVVEQGRHEDLLKMNGAYARLYYSQLAPQKDEELMSDSDIVDFDKEEKIAAEGEPLSVSQTATVTQPSKASSSASQSPINARSSEQK
jgi:ABC-type multidrug transport system fused ATPase/permease subunit